MDVKDDLDITLLVIAGIRELLSLLDDKAVTAQQVTDAAKASVDRIAAQRKAAQDALDAQK